MSLCDNKTQEDRKAVTELGFSCGFLVPSLSCSFFHSYEELVLKMICFLSFEASNV